MDSITCNCVLAPFDRTSENGRHFKKQLVQIFTTYIRYISLNRLFFEQEYWRNESF